MGTNNGSFSLPDTTRNCTLPYEKGQLPLMVLYSVVLIVGIPTNLATIYFTYLQVCRKNVLGIYLLSLSVCDLMYLCTLPMWIVYINSGHRWHLGSLACKVTGYVFFNNMYVSIFLLCCVSVDRYVAVVYAVESRGLRRRKGATMVTMVIVVVVALGHTPVFTMTEGETEGLEKRCFEPGQNTLTVTGFNYARFFVGFVAPLCVLLATNHAVLAKVHASEGLRHEQKARVRCLALAVILLFLICFTPYHAILLLRAISFHISEYNCNFERALYTPYTISLGLSTINSAMNPILYVLASDNIRREILRNMSSLRSSSFFKFRLSDSAQEPRNHSH
ncbi:probable G-protein coupled receptor 132 [Electrophorus electricus]|uniref:probable G-protein coupled receptor 132 n=1 Tax=Electrophorus electricus TaxID=8005 RepID=UPI0015CFE409|nr:probable G-protein coupled receptor 132 [Electrophorus electricus]